MAVTPNTVRITLQAVHEASQRISVFHYRTAATHVWTTTELLALASAFWTAVGPSWRASCVTGVNPIAVVALDLGNDPAAVATYNVPSGNTGLQSGEPVPSNCAGVISWRGPFAGRSYQGRTYTYGFNEASTNGSTLVSSAVTNISAYALQLSIFTNFTGTNVGLAIFSRKLNISTLVGAYTVDALVDSQRRRLLNRGN